MPRRRKPPPQAGNQGGYGAQPAAAPTGMPYGEHQASIESQRQQPLAAVPTGPAALGGAPGGAGAPPQMDQATRLRAAVEAARRMRPPQPLTGISRRPSEPITAGMPIGAGAGPEVLRTGDRTVRTLRLLADVTGDPAFSDLAERAALRGR